MSNPKSRATKAQRLTALNISRVLADGPGWITSYHTAEDLEAALHVLVDAKCARIPNTDGTPYIPSVFFLRQCTTQHADIAVALVEACGGKMEMFLPVGQYWDADQEQQGYLTFSEVVEWREDLTDKEAGTVQTFEMFLKSEITRALDLSIEDSR